MSKENPIVQYAVKNDDGTWQEAYESVRTFMSGLVCSTDKTVYELTFFEVGKDDEWDFVGWRSFIPFMDDDVSLVFPDLHAFEMCFTYGTKAEIEHGRGEIVYLKLESEKELGIIKDLKHTDQSVSDDKDKE